MTGNRKERGPYTAAFLSFVMVGLGQLYNGQLRRAAALYALSVLLAAVLIAATLLLVSLLGAAGFYIIVLLVLCVRVFAIADAFIGARRIGMLELKRFNRWYVYLAVFLAYLGISEIVRYPAPSYSIPSGGMHPTLLIGDYLRVSRFAYSDHMPERGDIAVFWKPGEERVEYIKRIVGLPGDRIQMINGVLHIDAKPVERERIEDFEFNHPFYGQEIAAQYIETLPNGRKHRILESRGDSGEFDSTEEITVPAGYYFAMGDNRDNSMDSRVIGLIPAENLIGRAEILFFSVENEFAWWQVWHWPATIRFDRIGREINTPSTQP